MSDEISLAFAKQLLTALHGLDNNLGQLDTFSSKLPSGEEKDELVVIIGDLMGAITEELMIPIYREHRALGRPSEPGEWLSKRGQDERSDSGNNAKK